MDLIARAIPFFLLALLAELAVDKLRGTGFFRANDAINSLSAGTLSTLTGYFTGFVAVAIWGYVLQNFAIIDMPLAWFDASPRGLLLWTAAVLGWDLCYYLFHRYSHEISVLWAAHAVHHQSEDYNLSTALRQTSTGFIFSWIFYVPLFVIGFPYEILLTVNGANLIYQFWVHTQHINRLGWADRVFVTPSNHRVHHAQNERDSDLNYVGRGVIWDRLFGTFQEELDEQPVIFGVRKPLQNWNPFWANLQVYDYLLFDAVRTRRWRDKIGIWFRRTGRRPADVATEYPKKSSDLRQFQKFDPPVARGIKRYVIAQFVLGALSILWIGNLFANQGPGAVLLPSVLLGAGLYTLGLMNEGRQYAMQFELLRVLVVLPLGIAAMLQSGSLEAPASQVYGGLGLYVFASTMILVIVFKNNK